MKVRSSARFSVVTLLAFGLVFGANSFAVAAPHSGGFQNPGGVRGQAATSAAMTAVPNLNISITYNGKAASKAQVSITSPKGAVVASGSASKSGVFSASLGAGTYAVAASSNGHVATGTVTMGGSAKSLSLTLR
jgi:hypothetical protein